MLAAPRDARDWRFDRFAFTHDRERFGDGYATGRRRRTFVAVRRLKCSESSRAAGCSHGENAGGYTFPRRCRLTTARDYGFVFRRPVRSADALFTVLARSNRKGHARLGLAISKKNIKTAVARNRIKRLVRESFRHHLDLLKNFDIVVLARPRADRHDNRSIGRSLQNHWNKLSR